MFSLLLRHSLPCTTKLNHSFEKWTIFLHYFLTISKVYKFVHYHMVRGNVLDLLKNNKISANLSLKQFLVIVYNISDIRLDVPYDSEQKIGAFSFC